MEVNRDWAPWPDCELFLINSWKTYWDHRLILVKKGQI